jgi:hypothetical protein
MEIGMLWFDESERSLQDRAQDAAAFYADKYGQAPSLCIVHPSMVNGEGNELGELELRKARTVMPNHFWVGVDEKAKAKKASPKAKAKTATSKAMRAKAKKASPKAKAKTATSKAMRAKAKKAA